MLLDQGGARMRAREDFEMDRLMTPVKTAKTAKKKATPEASVRVAVTETHDGEACDCIDKEMVLKVGGELELEHICHDGRVDKVIARVLAIDVPAPTEHGKATVS